MHAWEPEEDEMGKWAARIVCLALAAALSAPFASLAFAQERAASASDEAPAASGAEGGPAAAGTGGTQGADAGAEDQGRLVRVAFPQAEGLSMIDERGRRSGVLYDWLVEIAKYTGWRYEFVEGSVDELVKQTMAGSVDLMGGMFYREQLDESLDYSVFSMGSNRSLVIGSSDDESVVGFDLRSLDGKTIGAYANATEKIRRLENFLEFNGLDCTVLRLDLASYESCLDDGTADLMLGSDVEMRDGCKVVAEFDGEPHYLAVPEGSDLMAGVDEAMRQIYAADPNFSRSLYNRYFPDDYASPIAFSEADRTYVASPDSDATLDSPMMAFMGVRISWDMRERKSAFAWPVSSAFSSLSAIIRLRTFDPATMMAIAPTSRKNTSDSTTTSSGLSDTNDSTVAERLPKATALREYSASSSSSEKLFTALLSTEYRPESTGRGSARENEVSEWSAVAGATLP